ncbi:MoaD/ThiS family protein [Candidatus Bathyarchaeota archaeon]|nr:MoaD/ThiS family protein [Candidatus Bathyarchaeota archaeon]
MNLTVRFVGSLRGISGKSKITLKLDKETVLTQVIKKLTKDFPMLEKALIDFEQGELRPNTLILVNGKEISVLKGLETMLRDGDEVVFVPVSHGG